MARKKQAPPPAKIRIRKNDTVKVITGKDKGKSGRVLEVNHSTGRVLVEGVNLVKKHTRPNPAKQIKGGIAEREAPIHVSNVMVVDSDGKPTRVGYRTDDESGKRVRIAKTNGKDI